MGGPVGSSASRSIGKRFVPLFVGAAVLGIGAVIAYEMTKPVPQLFSPTWRAIEAGHVKVASLKVPGGTPQTTLRASFRILDDPARNVFTNRTGGACLLADLNPYDIPQRVNNAPRECSSASDCAVPKHYADQGWYGYCARNDRPRGRKGQCWVRPGPPTSLCTRSPDHPKDGKPRQWTDGSHAVPLDNWYTIPTDAAGRPTFLPPGYPYSGSLRWRVQTCLNIVDGAGNIVGGCQPKAPSTDQQVQDRSIHWSNPVTIKTAK